MGITGLIPFLEKASSKINIKDVKGCTVAIDTYCWLHKGAYGCADKLSRGERTNIHILYCMKFVNMLLSCNIKPIMVFDGRHLPAKALTESRRRENRNQAKKRAAELLRLGQIEEAKIQMRRCVDITHDMVLDLMKECRKLNVDCIVAPYEADAQLAYLNKRNIAQYVITEDSDLTLFGANKIIFKLDLTGNCLLVEAEKLYLAMGCNPERYTFDKFRNMCILSGCDYLDSLPGIGLAKACKFMLRIEETDMRIALKRLPRHLNMKNLVVSEEYIDEFLKAEATFKHMYVYDPLEKRMLRLNDIPQDMENYHILCSNAGSLLDDETSFQLALGNLNPFTLEKVDDWHPSTILMPQKRKSTYSSIWDLNYKPQSFKRQATINAFTFKKIKYTTIDEPLDLDNEKDECVIASLYSMNVLPGKRSRNSESPDMFENTENCLASKENKHNPFAKLFMDTSPKNISFKQHVDESPKLDKLERLSKFERTIVDNSIEVKSRFFSSNTTLVQKLKNRDGMLRTETSINNNSDIDQGKIHPSVKDDLPNPGKLCPADELHPYPENEISFKETDTESSDNLLQCVEFNSKPEETYKDDIEIIDISDSEINSKTEIKKKAPRIVLTRNTSNKSKSAIINSQTRLSMFGFKKK